MHLGKLREVIASWFHYAEMLNLPFRPVLVPQTHFTQFQPLLREGKKKIIH